MQLCLQMAQLILSKHRTPLSPQTPPWVRALTVHVSAHAHVCCGADARMVVIRAPNKNVASIGAMHTFTSLTVCSLPFNRLTHFHHLAPCTHLIKVCLYCVM